MTKVLPFALPPLVRRGDDVLFDSVVVGIDFEPASLAAARWATAHVARDAHVILAHAAEGSPDDGLGTSPVAAPPELRAIHGGLAGVARTLGLARPSVAVRAGRASRWLSEVANEAEASLIVLGRRRDANRKRIGEPNVIERVVRRTDASALVVPEGTTAPPARVVAAVDESRQAASVVRAALRLARRLATPLTILHVLAPVAGAYDRVLGRSRARHDGHTPPDEVKERRTPDRLPARTARWLVQLLDTRRSDTPVSVEVAVGDPAREITGTALAGPPAVIVVGQRGADEAPVGSLGSVARELLTRATVPVLAVAT